MSTTTPTKPKAAKKAAVKTTKKAAKKATKKIEAPINPDAGRTTADPNRHEVFGLKVTENKMSNPNGDPSNEGLPRQLDSNEGWITPVSVHRKLRDLIHTRSDAFLQAARDCGFSEKEIQERFGIYVVPEVTANVLATEFHAGRSAFNNKYYDARVFGSTLLEKESRGSNPCGGPVALAPGISLNPIEVIHETLTRRQGTTEGKDRDIANGAFKVAAYGIYTTTLHISWEARRKMGVDQRDIDLYLALLPHAYDLPSAARQHTEIVQLFTLKKTPQMTISRESFAEICRPKLVGDITPDEPATGRKDYQFETKASVENQLKAYFSKKGIKWNGDGLEVYDAI